MLACQNGKILRLYSPDNGEPLFNFNTEVKDYSVKRKQRKMHLELAGKYILAKSAKESMVVYKDGHHLVLS